MSARHEPQKTSRELGTLEIQSQANTMIAGKVVAITGASSGIGRAAARLLAERGAKVVLGARRANELEAVANEIRTSGGEAACRLTDVSNRDDMASLCGLASDHYGKLDVLIRQRWDRPDFKTRGATRQ